MYTPEQILKCFLETFDGSSIVMFRKYLHKHSSVTKWMIASDFALHDPSRPLDCFAFTIIPYDQWPSEIEADVLASLPKDFKKSKDLSDEAATWLRDNQRFHIVFTFNKDRAFFFNDNEETELDVARKSINLTVEGFKQLQKVKALKKAKKLQQNAKAKNFNPTLLADIWLLSMLYASISVLICRERNSQIIGLFPDRDNMTIYCDSIWFDIAQNMIGYYCDLADVDMRKTQLVGGGPDRSGSREVMWFDYMIRPADWFAGAIASWDRQLNALPDTHDKYRQMIEEVVADVDNMTLIHGDMDRAGLQFRRIAVSRRPIALEADQDAAAPPSANPSETE